MRVCRICILYVVMFTQFEYVVKYYSIGDLYTIKLEFYIWSCTAKYGFLE
jgi:hypothetical protein